MRCVASAFIFGSFDLLAWRLKFSAVGELLLPFADELLQFQTPGLLRPVKRHRVGIARDPQQRLHARHIFRAAEDAGQGVVVRLWNRIELVIVAPCATCGAGQKGPASCVELFVANVERVLFGIALRERLRADDQKARADQAAITLGVRHPRIVRKQISRELLTHELVVRQIMLKASMT